MAEPSYEITITRRVPNPQYVPQRPGGYSYDRTSEQEQWLVERTMSASLTDAEYEQVKQALIRHWTNCE